MKKEYKSLQDERLREYNIMALYDAPRLQNIVEGLRLGFLNKKMPKIDENLVRRARVEAEKINDAYDAAMYSFALALYRYAFPNNGSRNVDGSVLGISASLDGSNNIGRTILAFDLGPNPWEVYKDQNLQKGKTLDTVLVDDKSDLWIRDNIDELHGFSKLNVERSRIFFPFFGNLGREGDSFLDTTGLNLDSLVPYLMWTGGYMGYAPVAGKYPGREEFEKRAPQQISYRLKNSLRPRLAQLVASERGLFQGLKETLADWAAVRAILEKEDDVYQFMTPFLKAYHDNKTLNIGNYVIDIIYIDDRFGENKKSNGYQDFKMAIRILQPLKIKNMLQGGLVVEMQVTDKMSFYNHEIDEKHRAHHLKRETERESVMPIAKDRARGQHMKDTMSNLQEEIAKYSRNVFDKIFHPYIMEKKIDISREAKVKTEPG